jgi:hypothetical protein
LDQLHPVSNKYEPSARLPRVERKVRPTAHLFFKP